MSVDAGSELPGRSRPDWNLPDVLDIRFLGRRLYERRPPRNFRSALADRTEAVEFLVTLSGPVPARALGPALFIGDVRVVECSPATEPGAGAEGEYRLRFQYTDPDRLAELASGTPITWGWADTPDPDRRTTGFRYTTEPDA
ncbi:hypothetical protein F0344_34275 [Streptomyces finlayi]|uniref:Uncharacterized protein n=1 Tax=Streptomyces finlayi TaxID=67296 RepID=A0A7G7BD34_9ACTN|nr:hypothetical protein [Streptomyces finlayi]QNE73249.1 hypothetical protein F0344_00085 [Streptomyces finlayi]QNE78975.1 hypothetical protein F0344_34275 [Streptomyces finlayi]